MVGGRTQVTFFCYQQLFWYIQALVQRERLGVIGRRKTLHPTPSLWALSLPFSSRTPPKKKKTTKQWRAMDCLASMGEVKHLVYYQPELNKDKLTAVANSEELTI